MSYRIGRVYKIIHTQSNICYVGSTFNDIRHRWNKHKEGHKYSKYKCSISPYFDRFGIENFRCILIKEYAVVDRPHLVTKEQIWINRLRPVNINNSLRFLYKAEVDKVYRQNNKDKIRERYIKYRENNKDKILSRRKKYRESHRSILNNKEKERYQQNRNKILEKSKKYRQENQHKIRKYKAEKVVCTCGKTLSRGTAMSKRHKSSLYHIQNKI